VICTRAAAFVVLPEIPTLGVVTGSATPKAALFDGSGTFSGSNGFSLNAAAAGACGYRAVLTAVSASNQYVAETSNVAIFATSGPSASLLASDTWTTVFRSGGASAWTIATVVDSATMQLYFTVTGVASTNITWVITIYPVRAGL
jgi:hypothetical protein